MDLKEMHRAKASELEKVKVQLTALEQEKNRLMKSGIELQGQIRLLQELSQSQSEVSKS